MTTLTRNTPQLLAEFGPAYIELGIPVIPVNGKRPAIKKWQERTIHNFHWIAKQFPNANIGLITGRCSGITVVDVDDAGKVDEAIEIFGDTPLKVKTPRGMHLYFRNNGERRRIRYSGLPIDILGEKSYCLAPPSVVDKGAYRLVQGRFEMLAELPKLGLLTHSDKPAQCAKKSELIIPSADIQSATFDVGSRNNDLFRFGCQTATGTNDRKIIEVLIREQNKAIPHPLCKSEVNQVIESICRYKSERKLFSPSSDRWTSLTRAEIEQLSPEAIQLLAYLRLHHGFRGSGEFVLANAVATKLSLSITRFRNAKKSLASHRLLEMTHLGGRGPNDPPRARLLGRLTDTGFKDAG